MYLVQEYKKIQFQSALSPGLHTSTVHVFCNEALAHEDQTQAIFFLTILLSVYFTDHC